MFHSKYGKKGVKKLTLLEKRLLEVLREMTLIADEDCPSGYRSTGFDQCLEESLELLKFYGKIV